MLDRGEQIGSLGEGRDEVNYLQEPVDHNQDGGVSTRWGKPGKKTHGDV